MSDFIVQVVGVATVLSVNGASLVAVLLGVLYVMGHGPGSRKRGLWLAMFGAVDFFALKSLSLGVPGLPVFVLVWPLTAFLIWLMLQDFRSIRGR